MKNFEFLLFILFLTTCCEVEKLNISIIDTFEAEYINPVVDEENNLYILTGNNNSTFEREALKYNSNGKFIESKSFSSDMAYEKPEILYIKNDDKKYLMSIVSNEIELYDINKNNITNSKELDIPYQYGTLKFLDSKNIFYACNQNNLFVFYNISLNYEYNDIEIKKEEIENINLIEGTPISCEISNDYANIICAYYDNDNHLQISAFSSDFKLQYSIRDDNENEELYFVKIVYLKESNKYIVINSISDKTSRLRYFKYAKNKFSNRLGIISDDNYLDEDKTQLSPLYTNNDIMAIDSTKILKISVDDNTFIISLYHFYEDDSFLSIKTFRLDDSLINDNYFFFKNPKLSIFNNIITLCLSTSYLSETKTGYFFISYPKAVNLTISNNSDINVKDLVKTENNIFKFESKIKIISIPQGFVFYDSLNNIIQNGSVLDTNDSLVFKEYLFSNKKFYLKYQVFSIGKTNNNYTYEEKYPVDSNKEVIESEILIKGEEENLTISINECGGNGFAIYIKEGKDICSKNIEGYYLDEKDNKYKPCHRGCKSCKDSGNDESMNCYSCYEGYMITEDTGSCLNKIPPYYYLDKNILKKCYTHCASCYNYTNTSCLSCEKDYKFMLSSNSCISEGELNYYENLSHSNSRFEWVFLVIFVISVIISFIMSVRPIHEREVTITRLTYTGTEDSKDIKQPINSRESLEMGLIDSW